MTTIFVSHTPDDSVCVEKIRQDLEAKGYATWRTPASLTIESILYPRTIENGILGSACIVLVWSKAAAGSEWVERQILFAQQLKKPIMSVLLDSTVLPTTVVASSSVASQGSCADIIIQLVPLLPPANSPDPLIALAERAAHAFIRERRAAIEQAVQMIQQNEHREEIRAILGHLAQNDLIMGVRTLAKEALRADAAASQASSQRADGGPIVLSDEPLAESETSITLEIVSESEAWRGNAPLKEIEGKITLNPQSNLLYALSPIAEPEAVPLRAPEDTGWDFYLVNIPFTLHKAPGKNYYRDITFIVELEKPGATAFDLFPGDITAQINDTTFYTVSSDMKIEKVENPSKQTERPIRFKALYPLIRAFGEGEQRFYWRYEGSEEQKEVPPGTKHALIVLRVPRGTQVVDGMIRYKITVAKHLHGLWGNKDSEVPAYPIRWALGKAVPTFFARQDLSEEAGRSRGFRKDMRVDVCILCALAEEAEGLKEAFKEELGATFQREYQARLKREYDYTLISNVEGEELGILVTWLPNMGSLETSLQLRPFLEEFKPRFAAMTGICAGDREKVKLGDIIVAERAFLYDVGKFVNDEEGQPQLRHDTQTWSPPTEVVHFARGFRGWEPVVARESRPLTRRQQQDWLLQMLLELHASQQKDAPRVDDIALPDLEANAPQWRTIVSALQSGPDAYLTRDRRLKNYRKVADLRYGKEMFPYKDPQQPEVFIAPVASGNAVRSDRPFATIKEPVRGTIAIDMEGVAFYRTLTEFSATHYLLVKSVSDYADEQKDDSYHTYASKISARYILTFIREYVIARRLPLSLPTQPKDG